MKDDDATKPDTPAPKPTSATERKPPLVLSPRMKDVTAKYAGQTIAIVGAPPRRKA